MKKLFILMSFVILSMTTILYAQNYSKNIKKSYSCMIKKDSFANKTIPATNPIAFDKNNDQRNLWLNFFNFNSIANITALITALIALGTLYEMKRQRKISMMPDLCVSPIFYRASLSDDNIIEWNTVQGGSTVDDFKIQSQNKEIVKSHNKTSIRIDNIGLGTAKMIKVSWLMDLEFQKSFNSLATAYHNNILKFDGGIFHYAKQTLPTIDMPKEGEYIQYLLSASISNTPVWIDIPEPYLFLFLLHMRLLSNTVQNIINEIPDYPSLELSIEYYDIENNPYKKKYRLILEKIFVGRPVSNMKSLEVDYKLSIKNA